MMIKICEANRDALRNALRAVNGSATATTMMAEDVIECAHTCETALKNRRVSAKSRPGVSVNFRPAGPRSKSYKYRAITTRIRILRRSTAWWLAAAERDHVHPGQPQMMEYELTDEAMVDIVQGAVAGLGKRSREQARELILRAKIQKHEAGENPCLRDLGGAIEAHRGGHS